MEVTHNVLHDLRVDVALPTPSDDTKDAVQAGRKGFPFLEVRLDFGAKGQIVVELVQKLRVELLPASTKVALSDKEVRKIVNRPRLFHVTQEKFVIRVRRLHAIPILS